jgi:biopolymer transport protein ExbD
MRSRRKRKASSEVNLGFQIAPMIDVVFVIMLYFMVMAGAVQVENAHNTKLPGTVATETDTPLPDEIALRIDTEGQVYLNDDPLDSPTAKDLPEVTRNLAALRDSSAASKSEVLVTVYADEQASYERVIDVLDVLTETKISNVTFQAGDPEN